MNRISKHIAQKLIDKLPGEEQYYSLDDLRNYGFPEFVVNRVQVELEQNLAESIVPPQTDWANMNSDAVQDAWQQFVNAILKETRLPASYARSIVETAVEDIIYLLIQPRKNLPDIIFGASEELSYDEIVKRMEAVVVYRHFSSLIPRYMKKKGLQSIKKGRCADIIAKADKKLTSNYTPLNWAQMLGPLFKLLDNQIDSNLLYLFFEDKEMPEVARQFEMRNNSLNRAELIEMLSSPELINKDDTEVDLDIAVKPRNIQKMQKKSSDTVGATMEEDNDNFGESGLVEGASENHLEITAEEEKDEEENDSYLRSFNQTFIPEKETGNEDKSFSLNTIFTQDEVSTESKKKYKIENREKNNPSLNDIFSEEPEDSYEEDSIEQPQMRMADQYREEEKKRKRKDWIDAENKTQTEKEEPKEDEEIEVSEIAEDVEVDQETTPMWQRFLSPDEKKEMEFRVKENQEVEEEEEPKELEEPKEKTDEDGFIEKPIIDLTEDDEAELSQAERLKKLLDDERARFVEVIFSGSEEAFEDAIDEIALKDSWRSASRYIEKEIYKRNLVDMYSETAVDFTDRLQSYFIEEKKVN